LRGPDGVKAYHRGHGPTIGGSSSTAMHATVSRAQRSTEWCAADTAQMRKSGTPDLRGPLRLPSLERSRISGAPLRAAPHPGHPAPCSTASGKGFAPPCAPSRTTARCV